MRFFPSVFAIISIGLYLVQSGIAQEAAPQPPPAQPTPEAAQAAAQPNSPEASSTPTGEASAQGAAQQPATGVGVNLLGQANTDRGEGRRNENVQISLVDNNAQRDANQRLGATTTIVEEFRPERGYFSAEFGSAPKGPIHAPQQRGSGFHGNLFWNHNNSIFSARSFFQVGSVQPARQNQYGAALATNVWKDGFFSFSGSQDKNRGMVNGNVIIPLPEERIPLTNDPVLKPYVENIISAFPNVPPNRPDVSARALNANSPQGTNTDFANGQFTQRAGTRDSFAFRYTFTGQQVQAFQFVRGQNPDTTNKSHSARITWNRAWNASTVSDFSFGFDRQGTLIMPAEGAIGPIFFAGLTGLGPSTNVPLMRAQNQWLTSYSLQRRQGRHALTAGATLVRRQFNSSEAEGMREITEFRSNFGRDVITNLRMGAPSIVYQAYGDIYRGFRSWDMVVFAGDHWNANNRLMLNYGIRYEPSTKPVDVRNLTVIPFDSDLNNVGGTFGLAYRLPRGYGVLRAAGATIFGQIYPASYSHARMNPPHYVWMQILAPDMSKGDPFAGIDPGSLDPNTRSSRSLISPNLATPYSYQYNFSWEGDLRPGWKFQLGYVGSRSHKLFSSYTLNRARPVPGMPLTVQNVNDRRPDSTAFEVFSTNNGSNGYYDAARTAFIMPSWHGLTMNTAYWFSKAIDLGGDYTNTGGVPERFGQGGQTELGAHKDLKARSNFDQPHAWLMQAAYDTGRRGSGWLGWLRHDWNISAVYLLKSGTPFNIETGSDGPGLGNVDGATADRPNILDPSILGRTVGSPDLAPLLLPRSAFAYINADAGDTAGSLGRNAFRKGKIANTNLAISRTWALPHDFLMTFRAEAINFTNTPQFAEPGRQLASPNFGQITNTLNDGRTFRFLLRFGF